MVARKKKDPIDKLLEEPDREIAPMDLYCYYGMDTLLQLLIKKGILETRDMRLLVKRLNERIRKAGYR
jgi:hypothetical protein